MSRRSWRVRTSYKYILCLTTAFDYSYHKCYDVIHTRLTLKISGKSGMSLHDINALICDGMNDAIVHCSKILTNCIEPKANIEMQNEQWKILQLEFSKLESFENFQCEQYLTSSSTTQASNYFDLMDLTNIFFWSTLLLDNLFWVNKYTLGAAI